MAEKVLIYAGTTEGRLLAQELSRAHIACDVHVATEYGQMVMPELAGVKVCVGRLDVEEMRALLKKNGQNNYAAVVDATHPFATEVSANIRESTKGSGIPYLRLQRRMYDGICSIPENEGMKERAGTVHVFADYESCVQALTDTSVYFSNFPIFSSTLFAPTRIRSPLSGSGICGSISTLTFPFCMIPTTVTPYFVRIPSSAIL